MSMEQSLGDENTLKDQPPKVGAIGQFPQTTKAFKPTVSETINSYSVELTADSVNLQYVFGGERSRQYTIHLDRIPAGGFLRWLAWRNDKVAKATGRRLIHRLVRSEAVTGRTVSQNEAEGIALCTSRQQFYLKAIIYSPIVVAAGLTWKGRKTMKLPMSRWRSNNVESSRTRSGNFESFPSTRMPLFTGQTSRNLWHVARFGTYYFVYLTPLLFLIGGTGNQAQKANFLRDERVRSLHADYQKIFLEPPGSTPENTPSARSGKRSRKPNEEANGSESPGHDYQGEMVQAIGGQEPSRDHSIKPVDQDVPFFDDDDRPNSEKGTLNDEGWSGSAWDRLRQKANSGSNGRTQEQKGFSRRPQVGSQYPSGSSSTPESDKDSFGYRGNDQERKEQQHGRDERARAQAEFDRMIEAERRGHNFEEAGSGQ